MELVITDKKKGPDKYTGLFPNSNGGTERMYHELMERLPDDLKQKFQIICSRFREFEPNKLPIMWFHDLVQDPEVKRFANPEFRKPFKKLVFVSDWQLSQYNLGMDITYHESIVLKNCIVPIEKVEKPKDKINIIYHTTPHRGLDILYSVVAYLAKNDPNIHLDVYSSFNAYGWPMRDQPYEELFNAIKNHPQMTYHGYQPNSVVREALQKAHIFGYPCVWPETSCIAAIEAMSAGALVVTPNLAALPETIGNFGFLYHYDEDKSIHAHRFAEVMAISIQKLRNNEITFLNSASNRIEQLYSWDRRIREWEVMLRTVIDDESKSNEIQNI